MAQRPARRRRQAGRNPGRACANRAGRRRARAQRAWAPRGAARLGAAIEPLDVLAALLGRVDGSRESSSVPQPAGDARPATCASSCGRRPRGPCRRRRPDGAWSWSTAGGAVIAWTRRRRAPRGMTGSCARSAVSLASPCPEAGCVARRQRLRSGRRPRRRRRQRRGLVAARDRAETSSTVPDGRRRWRNRATTPGRELPARGLRHA